MPQRLLASIHLLSLVPLLGLATQGWADSPLEVTTPQGVVQRTLSPQGEILGENPPGSPAVAAATAARAAASGPGVEQRTFRDPDTGREVDADGVVRDSGSASAAAAQEAPATLGAAAATPRITIDRMTFGAAYGETFDPATGLVIFGPARYYFLSDGTSWQSGAGVFYRPSAAFDRVEVDGTTIRYYFTAPSAGFLYKQTDYDSGNHSSNGSLGAAGPLVLEATLGATTGTMSGDAVILSNVPANYSEPRFNYWSSPLGSVVPFQVTVTLTNGATFTESTFDSKVSYKNDGVVDFAHPSHVPMLTAVEVMGSGQVPAGVQTPYVAVATYESGAKENVTDEAVWSVTPAELASVAGGLLETAADGCDGMVLELRASFTSDGVTETGTKSVVCRAYDPNEAAASWETYQGDERHTGYVPISLDPDVFSMRWQRVVAAGRSLNPVAAADGRVFVSLPGYFDEGTLFALDSRDGEPLWSRDLGAPFSVNPPAYGYGNVYIQTGNHSNDTYLWAFDAATGDQVFKSPHAAQWERYYAPTIYRGGVYVDGGYYGGMYAFDAFSGQSLWFATLQQYDQFTPAVDDDHVYAYVGEYSPALYVVDRASGQPAYNIPDPNFEWNGWSMNLAPVLGSMDDVLAIHDGRLIRFDLGARRIGFEITESFSGQPSVAKGVIYAINGGSVEARDEASGALRWRWTPASGAASGTMIVTDSHLLVCTATETDAIELLSGESDWSFPASGFLALADETLYIASANGTLTAISIPEYTPAPPTALEIEGPAAVEELTTASYEAWVHYADGRVRRRTELAEWSVAPKDYAAIDASGGLAVTEMLQPQQTVVVHARYREGENEVEGSLEVTLAIGVSLDEFVRRNVEEALAAKRSALDALAQAQEHELAAIRVLKGQLPRGPQRRRSPLQQTMNRLWRATFWGLFGQHAVQNGVMALEDELNGSPTAPGPGDWRNSAASPH